MYVYRKLEYMEKQVNVKLFLCLIKHHAMKTGGGVEVLLHAFVISALAAFPPGKQLAVLVG
jgi:hypothetical protein